MRKTIMDLKETRAAYGLSQKDAALSLGVPLRTYRRYECDEGYGNAIKRQAFVSLLKERYEVDEDHGLLSVGMIREKLTDLFNREYPGEVSFCYLFGSYAKGTPNDRSDVDLYVATSLMGLSFVGLIESIRQALHKRVDVIRGSELVDNIELVNEILKDGIKIYG